MNDDARNFLVVCTLRISSSHWIKWKTLRVFSAAFVCDTARKLEQLKSLCSPLNFA